MTFLAALLLQVAFPMAEGTRWTYRGTTRARVTRHISTTMRVIEHADVGRYEVALFEGTPDTISCERVPEPRRLFTVVIRDRGDIYELPTPNPTLEEQYDTEQGVKEAIAMLSPSYSFPMHGRKTIGKRSVEEIAPHHYRLTYRAGDETEIVEIEDGVGVTRYYDTNRRTGCTVELSLASPRRR